ncbi:uncharacterized protein LOC120986640 [Bufo bufo]|uniref:uncharacterized protein LOC120986640 n=1 Tax=Bufo bufo TaxID=8384 RepID=UPI001ABE36BF|nr:uncharacterized protein LOC120986640 [Bufo bufo]
MSYDPLSPIQSQPRRQENTYVQKESHKRELVARSGLQCLADVEEVVLKRNVFSTRSGKALFGLYMGSMQRGPDLCFRDPNRKDLAALYLLLREDRGKAGTYLRVVTPSDNTIGYVNSEYSPKIMNISILMANNDLVFTSRLPKGSKLPKAIQIFSINQSRLVAEIKLKEQKFSQVVFHFLSEMDVTLKMLVLAAFLYMNFQAETMNQTISLHVDFRKIFIKIFDEILENEDICSDNNDCVDTDCGDNRLHCKAVSGLNISHKEPKFSNNKSRDDDCCGCSCYGICCCDSDCDDSDDCDCNVDICCGDW